MGLSLAALILLQAAAPVVQAGGGGGEPGPRNQRSVGVSVSASATILAPIRIVRDQGTGAVLIEGQRARPQSRRDETGILWIEFS